MSALNENIRKFRELRKMTQKNFAEQLNKSRNVISNWERGENSPDPDTIEHICNILSVTPNQIFGWEPCPEYERYQKRLEMYNNTLAELEQKRDEIEQEMQTVKKKMKEESFTEE